MSCCNGFINRAIQHDYEFYFSFAKVGSKEWWVTMKKYFKTITIAFACIACIRLIGFFVCGFCSQAIDHENLEFLFIMLGIIFAIIVYCVIRTTIEQPFLFHIGAVISNGIGFVCLKWLIPDTIDASYQIPYMLGEYFICIGIFVFVVFDFLITLVRPFWKNQPW